MKRIFTLSILFLSLFCFAAAYAQPTITGVSIAAGTYKIGDNIVVTITTTGTAPTGIKGSSLINNVLPTTFSGSSPYTVIYPVGSGNTDALSVGVIPISITLTSGSGDSNTFTAAPTSPGTVTIDANAPTNQDVVFAASISKQGGAAVTIVSSGTASNNVWFAPAGTTVFVAGATMTKATNGTSTSILAPATAGSYNLFVLDAVGNISNASTATLTVDNTPPSITLAVASPSTGFAKIGDIVTITVTAGETLLTQGTSTINGQAITSFLDNGDGTYNLTYTVVSGNTDRAAGALPFSIILTDAAGNNSSARTTYSTANTLVIDANAPNNQNTVYPSSTAIQGGVAVTIVSSGTASNQVWFAPAGTTVFAASATMTQAASGTATSILAPATENPYKLFVLDAAGNISNASTATLTVDNTPPTAPSAPDLASGSDSGISSTDNITKTTNVTFNSTANVADNIGATIKIFSGATQIGSGAANGSGGYSISATLINANTGFQTITATATDPAGNASGSSAVLPGGVNYDTQAPTISGTPIYNANGSSAETIIVSFSETLGIANNASVSAVGVSSSTKGFTEENGNMGSAVYTSASNIVTLTAGGNNKWDSGNAGKDQMGYITGATNPCVDLAGNELGSTGGNTISIGSGSVPSFNSSLVLFPNGTGAETISFEVDQQLNISSGTAITGLTVSSGTLAVGGAIYTYNAGTSTALITLTNSGVDGSWTSATTVSYTGSGNITNAIGSMASFSNEKIIVSTTSIASNNAATNWAKTGNTVTVTFTLNKALSSAPTATIDGAVATVVLFSGTALTSGAVYKASTSTLTNEVVLPFVLTLIETSRSTDVTATLDGSNVTFDKTSPVVTPVQIISNNGTNTAYAKTGDIITVSYTPTDNLGTITTSAATIAGRTATTSTLASSTLTTDGSEPNGVVTFSETFTDQAGNSTVVTAVTNASSVTFDKVAPTVSTITPIIANNGPNGISNTTPLTYTVTFNEIVSGLSASDFTVTSIPASGPANFATVTGSVTGVSAGPAISYTVTVSTVSGTGQLRLDFTSNVAIIDKAGNPNALSFTTGTPYSVILAEPTNTITALTSSSPSTTSIKLDWTNPTGTQKPTHLLIVGIQNGLGTFPVSGVNDASLISSRGNWNVAADYGAVIIDYTGSYPSIPATDNTTIGGLQSGKQYDFRVYPYTLSPNNANNNVDYKTTGLQTTSATVSTASASTIIAGSTAAPSTISSVLAGSNTVFSFKIVDDGATSADNAPTTFTDLVINAKTGGTNTITDWTTAIASAQLVDITQNSGSPITGAIGTSTITFGSITNGVGNPGYIAQNAAKEYVLKITLKNPFTATIDNQSFDFTFDPTTFPTSITYGTGASKIASGQSRSTGSEQIIVNRTALKFTTQPAPLSQLVLTDFTTNPVVKAVDGNGNVDVDFTGFTNNVTITNPSSIKMNGVYPLVITPVAGVVTFPASFQYGDQGDGTLTATGGGYNSNSGAGFGPCNTVTVTYSQATTITLGSASNLKLSSLNTTANATTAGYQAFTFTITDDGGAGGDGAPTQFSSLVITPSGSDQFSPNWNKIIATATLVDVGTPTNKINGVVAGNTITFSGIPITSGTLGYITDSGSTNYALYISFDPNGTLKASADQLNFGFSVAKADIGVITASSQIPAGQIQSSTAGSNKFEVYATKLSFTTQPQAPSASANYLVSTVLSSQGAVPIVEAIDINGYRDRNYSVAVSTTSPVATPSGQPATITNGLINSFGSMQFTTIGNGTLTVTAAVTNGDTFTIPVVPSAAVSNPILVSVGTATKINSPSVSAGSISSITNTTSGSTVFTFSITDDPVGSVQNDGNATKINKIIISGSSANNLITDWTQAIAGARLENAANAAIFIDLNPATDIGTSTLTFSSIPFGASQLGEIQDDATKTYNLKIWLKSNLSGTQNYNQNIDGKTFGFDVTSSNVFVDPTGTALLAGLNANTTNVSTPVTVIATKLTFIYPSTPVTASLNTNFSGVIVQAQDANGNLDTGFTGKITTLSNATSATTINGPTIGTTPFAGGIYNFNNNFQFTTGADQDIVTLSIKADNTGGSSGTTCGTNAICGTSAQIKLLSSFESSVVADPTYTYSNTLAYISHQETVNNLTAASLEISRLLLVDGSRAGFPYGAATLTTNTDADLNGDGDADGAGTKLNSITIRVTNPSNLRAIALFSNGTQIGLQQSVTDVAGTPFHDFVFSGGPLVQVTDDSQGATSIAPMSVMASFRNVAPDVTDKDLIQVSVIAAAVGVGSQFYPSVTPGTYIAGVSGGVVGPTNMNFIDVLATQLDFTTQPGAFAGINEPITVPVVKARDANGLIDVEQTLPGTIGTPASGAGVSTSSLPFSLGVIDFTGFNYTSTGTLASATPGNGTLTVTSKNNKGNSITGTSNHVDVIHVSTSLATGGVPTSTNLASGSVKKVIFGVTFNTAYRVTGTPLLNKFKISFSNSVLGVFKAMRIFQSPNSSFGGFDVTTLPGVTVKLDPADASNKTLLIDFAAQARDLNANPSLSFFLEVDVDPTASGSTPSVQPSVTDDGIYLSTTNQNIVTSKGSAASNISGQTYTFAAIFPPTFVSSVPSSGQTNVDPNQATIDLTFSVPVWTLDDLLGVTLNDGITNTVIQTLTPVNGKYSTSSSGTNLATLGSPIKFNLPALLPNHLYYITIAAGKFGGAAATGNIGIIDQSNNLFPGISSPGTLYFKTANQSAPLMVTTTIPAPYTAASNPSITNISVAGATINATFDQKGKAYYLVLSNGALAPTLAQIKGLLAYAGAKAQGSFAINQVAPISQSGIISPASLLATSTTYDVWLAAENDALPTPISTTAHYGNSLHVIRTGTITANTGANTVTGSGTMFTTELSVGQSIYDGAGINAIGTISQILSNTSLILTNKSSLLITNGSYSGSSYEIGAAGPTFTFTTPATNPSSLASNNPSLSICTNSYQILNEPIVITESGNKNEFSGAAGVDQTFNLVLPSGFSFDVSKNGANFNYGNVILSAGSDFVAGSGTIGYIGSSILTVTFRNNGNSSLDVLTITGLRVIASSSGGGNITRLGGNAFPLSSNEIGDTKPVAFISSNDAPGILFTNSYSTQVFNNNVVSTIPDNYVDLNLNANQVQLTPLSASGSSLFSIGDFGPSTFSGTGVNVDLLSLSAPTLGTPFNITITHTDNNGCISVSPIQYTVYDHRTAVTIADNSANANNGPYCTTNTKFVNTNAPLNPINRPVFGIPSDLFTVKYNNLTSYYLDSLVADIPSSATAIGTGKRTDQIIFGAVWQNLVKNKLLVWQSTPFDPGNNPKPGDPYYDYKFDLASILDAPNLVGLPDPYSNFRSARTTAQGNYYYDGGSLGFVELTATYQSIANQAVSIPIKQNIEFFIPSVPVVEVGPFPASNLITNDPLNPVGASGTPNIGTPVFCKEGGLITVNGWPAASAGTSLGRFTLTDTQSGSIIYDSKSLPSPILAAGFVDNGNGTATIDPKQLNNGFKDITITYYYNVISTTAQVQPCASSATQIMRVSDNPVAQFSIAAAATWPVSNSSGSLAFCVTDASKGTLDNTISFTNTSSGTIKTYSWDFGDANSTTLNPNIASSNNATHKFPLGTNYTISLNLISTDNCPSLNVPNVSSKVIKVGEIPLPIFTFKGNCVTDNIAFDASTSKMPSVGSNSAIAKFIWDFDKMNLAAGNPPVPKTLTSPSATSSAISKYDAAKPGYYSVELTAISDVAGTEGCQSTNVQQIALLPLVPASSIVGAFEQPFDTDGGWVALDLSGPKPAAGGNSTWSYNATNKNWATATPYKDGEKSALYSACLDLSTVPRPMISFNTDVNVNLGEGLVLQYSKDADTDDNIVSATKTWETLGSFTNGLSSGLDWYKDAGQSGIASIPFNTSGYGWTGTTGLILPRHRLDVQNVAANKRLLLRFALGASNTLSAKTGGGVSIDNIRVGSRTRTILFENFTTTDGGTNTKLNSELASDASAIATFNTANISSTQVVNINYHVGFIGKDPFNFDNPADPSSRALFYNVSKVPYAFLDGKHSPEYAAANSSNKDLFGQWGQSAYDLQTLQLGKADFTGTKVDNILDGSGKLSSVKITVKAANTTTVDIPKQTSLFVAILEPIITKAELDSKVTGAKVTTGETTFPYVLKQMLPNAVGKRINPTGTSPTNQKLKAKTGSSLTFDDLGVFEWIPDRIYGTTKEFAVVIFLQNDSTKEVFQAELNPTLTPPATGANPNFSLPSTIITGIETISAESVNLYPNPANQEFTIELPRALRADANVRMIDQLGQTIDAGVLPTGKNTKTVSTFGLASGVYIVEILSDEGSVVRKKVIVVH